MAGMKRDRGGEALGRVFSRNTGSGLAGLLTAVCLAFACGAPQAPQADAPPAARSIEGHSAAPVVKRPEIGFASRQKMADHYSKHGREFGPVTMEQYLRKAQELRDRPAGGPILEAARADGVMTRFDRASGDFIAFNRDGVIRTYFRPADGEAYFQRQLRRSRPGR